MLFFRVLLVLHGAFIRSDLVVAVRTVGCSEDCGVQVPDRLHRPLIEYTWEQLYGRPWMPGTAQGDLLLNGPQPTDTDPLVRDNASQELCMVIPLC